MRMNTFVGSVMIVRRWVCFCFIFFCPILFAQDQGSTVPQHSKSVVISISGQISKNLLTTITQSTSQVFGDPIPAGLIVMLDSPGGDAEAAMKIGRLLRKTKAHVFVTGQCASACIFVLAGGVVRGAPGLSVGIHRGRITISDANAKVLGDVDVNQSPEARKFLNRYEYAAEVYFSEMGMSPALFEAMQAHQQKGVYRLSTKEIISFGLSGIEPAYLDQRALRYEKLEKPQKMNSAELLRRTMKVASYCTKFDRKPTEFLACYKEVLIDGLLN